MKSRLFTDEPDLLLTRRRSGEEGLCVCLRMSQEAYARLAYMAQAQDKTLGECLEQLILKERNEAQGNTAQ